MPAEQAERWTVLRLLEWTTAFFKKRGSESPRLDAEILLAEARGSSRIELYTAFDQEPPEQVREAFREMVRRRGEGAPVAYLVGHKEFYSLRLRVNEGVLIPRPETEHVVIEALDCAKQMNLAERPLKIADVGTGSGAIAIALAKHLRQCEVLAIDQSAAALEIARYNIDQHGVGDRVQAVTGDLLQPTDPALAIPAGSLDIVCSNPPYVSEGEYEQLDAGVRQYEPRSALLAGPDGTEVIERLVPQAVESLRTGGQLIIELSPMIADAAAQIVGDQAGLGEVRFVKDLAGHRRVLSVRRV